MKKFLRVISLALVFITVVATISILNFEVYASTSVTEEQFLAAINAAKAEYPHNYYWNEYNGKDANGIAKAGTTACNGKSNYNGKNCSANGYCGYKGVSCTCLCGYYHGWQCFGFGNLLAYKTLGSWATNGYSSSDVNSSAGWKYYSSVTEYYAGDFVRINNNGHTIFIYKVDENSVYYAECNAKGPCKINWEGKMSISKLKSITTFVVHKSGNTLKGTGASSNTLTVNYDVNGGVIGETYKVTVSDGLKVRSGPGTNYDRLGAYKVNNTFIVTEYKEMSDFTWGKVFYNDQYGWVALNDEWIIETDPTYYLDSSAVCKTGQSGAMPHVMTQGVTSTNGLYNITTFGAYKVGYDFVGWSASPTGDDTIFDQNQALCPEEIVPELADGDSSITLYAIWALSEGYDSYTVSYDANGGEGAPNAQTKVNGEDLIISSEIPTRSGYIFKGWSADSSDKTATYQGGDVYSNDVDVILYAVWSPDADEFTLNMQVSMLINAGETRFYYFVPEESGKYAFYSFNTDDAIAYLYDAEFNELAMDDDSGDNYNFRLVYDFVAGETYIFSVNYWDTEISAYANISLSEAYTITYDANGGENAPEPQIKYEVGEMIIDSTVPKRYGYIFAGWSTDSKAIEAMYNPGDGYWEDEDIILYAVWVADSYTVTYDANGGVDAPETQMKLHDVELVLSKKVPVRIGYYFIGWSVGHPDDPDSYSCDSGSIYRGNGDITLYAIWSACSEEITPGLSYFYNFYGSVVYYLFKPEISGIYVFDSSVKEDTIAYLYDSDYNQLAMDDNGGENLNFQIEYYFNAGETYLFAAKFNGSHEDNQFVISLSSVHFTISYDANGGTNAPKSQMKKYGETISLSSTIPTREGYTFKGWSTNPSATDIMYRAEDVYSKDEGDVILYAVWSQNEVEKDTETEKNTETETELETETLIETETQIESETETETETDTDTDRDVADSSESDEDDKDEDDKDDKEDKDDKDDKDDKSDKEDDDEDVLSKGSGCTSSVTLSSLAIVGIVGAGLVLKKRKDD